MSGETRDHPKSRRGDSPYEFIVRILCMDINMYIDRCWTWAWDSGLRVKEHRVKVVSVWQLGGGVNN